MGIGSIKQNSGGRRMKEMSIKEIEERIAFLEDWLSTPIKNRKVWSNAVSEYHALNLKLGRMTGGVVVNEFQSEHII